MVRTRPSIWRKNVCLKMRHELGNPFPDGECFLAEMLRQSHRSLGIMKYGFSLESALQNTTKMNKESIDLIHIKKGCI